MDGFRAALIDSVGADLDAVTLDRTSASINVLLIPQMSLAQASVEGQLVPDIWQRPPREAGQLCEQLELSLVADMQAL